jgi:hypothetical protein
MDNSRYRSFNVFTLLYVVFTYVYMDNVAFFRQDVKYTRPVVGNDLDFCIVQQRSLEIAWLMLWTEYFDYDNGSTFKCVTA